MQSYIFAVSMQNKSNKKKNLNIPNPHIKICKNEHGQKK